MFPAIIDICKNVINRVKRQFKKITKLATYFQNNLARMDYATFREQGYCIGSGTVESGCKQIGTMRLKRSGACWLEKGARWIGKARAVWLSGQWQEVVQGKADLLFAI